MNAFRVFGRVCSLCVCVGFIGRPHNNTIHQWDFRSLGIRAARVQPNFSRIFKNRKKHTKYMQYVLIHKCIGVNRVPTCTEINRNMYYSIKYMHAHVNIDTYTHINLSQNKTTREKKTATKREKKPRVSSESFDFSSILYTHTYLVELVCV